VLASTLGGVSRIENVPSVAVVTFRRAIDGVLVSITVTGDLFCKSTNVVQRLDTELAQEFLQQYV
jgi:hypothetical protein